MVWPWRLGTGQAAVSLVCPLCPTGDRNVAEGRVPRAARGPTGWGVGCPQALTWDVAVSHPPAGEIPCRRPRGVPASTPTASLHRPSPHPDLGARPCLSCHSHPCLARGLITEAVPEDNHGKDRPPRGKEPSSRGKEETSQPGGFNPEVQGWLGPWGPSKGLHPRKRGGKTHGRHRGCRQGLR